MATLEAPSEPDGRAWLPAALRARRFAAHTVGTLSYIVVDELVDDAATLAVSPWPTADAEGRLRFRGLEDVRHVGVGLDALLRGLYERSSRSPREPRIGDVFAARLSPAGRRRLARASGDVPWDGPLTELFSGGVHDISEEARLVAKLAFFAAAVDVLAPEEAENRLLFADLDDDAAPADPPDAASSDARHRLPSFAAEPATVAWALPSDLLDPPDPDRFLQACIEDGGDKLVYFVLNVGDGDTQVLLLPGDEHGRRAVVVDVGTTRKLPALLDALRDASVLPRGDGRPLLPLVVATHPHDDHIRGLPELLATYGDHVQEVWEPGYYHPSGGFVETMVQLEARRQQIRHVQPTSGLASYLGQVRLVVLAPGIGLRNRFDSYGVLINDASLALRVEYPFTRVADTRPRDGDSSHDRIYVRNNPWSVVLGADAQTTAWAQATLDFPQLHSHHDREVARELRRTVGSDPLRAHVFKVPHHASKHGLNLELVSRIKPTVSLISCRARGRYGFPHDLAVESLREAQRPIATRGGVRPPDHDLGIHYTCAEVRSDGQAAAPLGTLALLLSPKRRTPPEIWRFGDAPGEPIDLRGARRMRRIRGG